MPVLPAEKRYPIPLLLVFALMNRPYILDLRPGHSFVEFMVNQGYDVYLLDWGAPGPEDKNLKFDDYTLEYMPRAIRKMKAISGSEEFSLLGWCIGAILTSIYSALRPDDGLRNLILLTAPLDFSNKQGMTFARWVDERYFDIDKVLGAFGNMPGEMIDYGAKALKPVENYITNYLKLWDNLDDPRVVEAWHAMNTWVTDNVPLAGGAFRQLIVDLYRHDKLMKGELMIRGERVDLQQHSCESADRDCRGRPHHAAVPVGADPGEGRQHGQRSVSRQRRAHRDHGGQRGAQGDVATHQPVAGGKIAISSIVRRSVPRLTSIGRAFFRSRVVLNYSHLIP